MSCPSNFVSPRGSDALSRCKCNLGYYGPLEGPCVDCPANTYTSVPDSANCSVCPENSVSPNRSTAASSCQCSPGYTGPNGGVCSACAVGTHKQTNRSITFTFCEVNYYGTTEAAVNVASCVVCPENSISHPLLRTVTAGSAPNVVADNHPDPRRPSPSQGVRFKLLLTSHSFV